jgi:hypothetical protein
MLPRSSPFEHVGDREPRSDLRRNSVVDAKYVRPKDVDSIGTR